MNMTGSKLIPLSGTVPGTPGRKLSDEAGRASEAQFRLLMDAMPQIVWMMRPDGQATYFNQRWLDYSGWSLKDSLGHGWIGLVHPDDSLRVSRLLVQACGGGEPCEIECRLRRADGVYRWMLGRTAAQSDAAGRTTQWLGTLTDIDELKQSREILEKDLAMNRIAGRVARLGGWAIELPERRLIWSDENCLIHDVPPGYQPTLEEGIGFFFPEHRAIVARHVQDCAEHGIPYEFVLPKRTATGRHIWVRSIAEAVRDEAGKIVSIQGAFQDISEQKEAEARMLALEARLTTTLENITDGFCLIDKDWKFTFMNGQAQRMLKRCPEDLLGKILWQEFPEAVGTRIERECRLAMQEQRTIRLETFYLPLKTWFHFHIYPTEARARGLLSGHHPTTHGASPAAPAGNGGVAAERHGGHHGSRTLRCIGPAHCVCERCVRAPDRLQPQRHHRKDAHAALGSQHLPPRGGTHPQCHGQLAARAR